MGLRRSIMGFDQEEVLKLTTIITKEVRGVEKEIELKLDMNDLLILKQIADFPNRKKITKILVDEKIFFWVSYKEIISELPILGIGKQALSDRLDKMVKLGVLEREIKTMPPYANMTLFRIGDKYERLRYKVEDSKDDSTVSNYDTVSCSTTIGSRSQIRDINNEYNNNKDDNNVDKEEKEDKSSSKKKDSFPFRQALIDLGVRPEIVNDWLIVRKNKRASNTETAFNRIKNEILKSGKSANDCITLAVERSWQGFMAEWMLNEISKGNNQKPKPKTQEEINREKLTMPILNDEGDLPDGTFFKNGHRWYFSKRDKKSYSIPPDAVPRPNDRSEYDLTRKDWYVPRDEWEASDEIW